MSDLAFNVLLCIFDDTKGYNKNVRINFHWQKTSLTPVKSDTNSRRLYQTVIVRSVESRENDTRRVRIPQVIISVCFFQIHI